MYMYTYMAYQYTIYEKKRSETRSITNKTGQIQEQLSVCLVYR